MQNKGLIISNISNLYMVEDVDTKIIIKCNARGKLKEKNESPVVGDYVKISITDKQKQEGVIDEILTRTNYIKRPKVANLSQIIFVISMKMPKPDLLMLDKQLAYAEKLGINAIIIINKIDLQDSYNYLEKVAKSMYPKCEVLYRWNTEDTIPLDKIPYIGEFSNLMPRIYVATGYKKWGMTSSNVAANIIVDKIMGNENENEEIFKATRMEPIKNIKEVGNIVKESVYSLVLHKLEIPKETLEQIQKDHGKVVEIEGKKVGVYKDSQGNLFKVRLICMHLGCELNWNNLDKTWDCPCHGSRYTYKGELIYGPSVKNLETYE